MAYGTALAAYDESRTRGNLGGQNELRQIFRPAQMTNDWQTVLDAGAVDTADNSASDIDDPSAQGFSTDHHVMKTMGVGTLAVFRLKYPAARTSNTNPVLNIFGRVGGTTPGEWMRLKNRAGDDDITLAISATVAENQKDSTGNFRYTTIHLSNTIVDLLGCDEVVAHVKTAYAAAGGSGDVATATVEVKII